MSYSSLKRRAVVLAAAATAVLAIAPATAFASGAGPTACGVPASGKVNCWGHGGGGKLGNNSDTDSNVPVEVQGITTAKYVSVGSDHVCAVLASGKVNCWGADGFKNQYFNEDRLDFKLGLGSTSQGDSLVSGTEACSYFGGCSTTYFSMVPVEVVGVSTAIQASAGEKHTCALLSSGKVNCWGNNPDGQLGNGSNVKSGAPVEVQGIATATQISSAASTSCAALASGKVKCWGKNSSGQFGNNSTDGSDVPVEVQGITTATQVDIALDHTCATLSSGKVNCWGTSQYGQLGNNSTTSTRVPVEVQGITTATQVVASRLNSCALLSSGKVNCWGNNGWGQLGNDSTDGSNVPVEVKGITTARQLLNTSSNSDGFCALLASGKVNCWGINLYGELGNNSTTGWGKFSKVPVEVSNVSTFAAFELPVVPARAADTTAPTAPGSFTGVPSSPTKLTGATIGFTLGETGGTVECKIDSGSWAACTSVSGTSGSLSLTSLKDGSHTVSVRQTDAAGNVSNVGTTSAWVVDTTVAPVVGAVGAPTVLTPAAGTKTVYKNGAKWAIKVGLLFSTGGDTRSTAQLLTVQVAADSAGKPVSAKPSDTLAPPAAATFANGVVAWDASGEVLRQSTAQPVWVRVGNKARKWSVRVKHTA